MLNVYVRRIHRWLTIAFSLPIAIVVLTGLALSFEPLVQQTRPVQSITASLVEQALARHDPERAARSLAIRTLNNTLTIGGAGGTIVVDLATGERTEKPQKLAQFLLTMRRMHETLLLDLGWLVTASTIAMALIISLGLLMGWPRFRNSLGGWHQGSAWVVLPLIVLSPLTGLAIAYGLTFTPPLNRSADNARVTMTDAVRLIAQSHDLASLTSVRPRGRIVMARIYVEGELRAFRVGASGLDPIPRNWPRLIHEGNWGGSWGPFLNVVTSLVLAGLLGTGITIWARRHLRRLGAKHGGLRAQRAAT